MQQPVPQSPRNKHMLTQLTLAASPFPSSVPITPTRTMSASPCWRQVLRGAIHRSESIQAQFRTREAKRMSLVPPESSLAQQQPGWVGVVSGIQCKRYVISNAVWAWIMLFHSASELIHFPSKSLLPELDSEFVCPGLDLTLDSAFHSPSKFIHFPRKPITYIQKVYKIIFYQNTRLTISARRPHMGGS